MFFFYLFLGAHAVPVPTQDGATTCTEINAMSILNGTAQFGPYDKVVSVVLEILEGCFTIEASPNNIEDHKGAKYFFFSSRSLKTREK